jgi:hypothetical protein
MNHPTDMQRELDAAELRRQQIEEGRRLAEGERRVISLPGSTKTTVRTPAPVNRGTGAAPVSKTKGHEAFLKALQLSGADIVIEKMSGDIYMGKLKHSDKYTLTVNVACIQRAGSDAVDTIREPYDRVLFKHDISEFYTTTAAPASSRAAAGTRV